MSLDKSDIEKIAWLARLAIDAEEIPHYTHELTNILGLVEQLIAVDTTGIEPMAHPQELSARLRQDKITENNQRDLFQAIAPAVDSGHYLVPKVIE